MSTTTMPTGWPLQVVEIIERLSLAFLTTDHCTPQEFKARISAADQAKIEEGKKDIAKKGDTSRWYLPVQQRIIWFNKQYPHGVIFSFPLEVDSQRHYTRQGKDKDNRPITVDLYGYAHYGAIIFDGRGRVGYAEKTENVLGFDDYIEKAQTGAIGRALANLGIGTQFCADLDEGVRIVDAPVDPPSLVPPVVAPKEKREGGMSTSGVLSPPPALPTTSTTTSVVSALPPTLADIKQEMATLMKQAALTDEEAAKLRQARKLMYPAIPEIVKDWTFHNYQQALAFNREWIAKLKATHAKNVLLTMEGVNEQLTAWYKRDRGAIAKLTMKLFKNTTDKLTDEERVLFLDILNARTLLYALFVEVDTNGKLLKGCFMDTKAPLSSLELITSLQVSLSEEEQVYLSVLLDTISSGKATLSQAFLNTYQSLLGKALEDYQQVAI